MGPITAIIPVTRTVPCGGRRVRVAEFRLRDLATLQAILDEESPDPLAEIQDELSRAGPDRRRELLVSAHEKAERGPAIYGQSSGHDFFSTPEGAAVFLWVAIRRRNKDIGPADAAKLWVACTASEFGRIWRICHGTTPLRAVENLLLGPAPQGDDGRPRRAWPDLIDELAQARPGWTYRDIYNLTITEWLYARNDGEMPEMGRYVRPGEDMRALGEEQARRYYGGAITDQEGEDAGSERIRSNP